MNRVKHILIFIIIISMITSVTVYGATPTTAKDFFTLGQTAYQSQKYEEAISNFDQAIKLDPKYNDSYLFKAFCLSSLKRTEEALACIEAAITQNPDIKTNYANKGKFLTDLGRYQEAIEAFKIGLQDTVSIYYYEMALAYLNLNDTDNCLKALRTYIIQYAALKEFIDEIFYTKLGANPAFIEIMGECRDKIEKSFIGSAILELSPFGDITFLDPSKSLSDAERQEISGINSRFRNNLINGNIYNEKTAVSSGISSQSPDKKILAFAGRIIKKLILVGFKASYTSTEFKVLYVGKTNGVLKAAIIYEKGTISFPGVNSSQSEDYYVYVKNNGIWELYADLSPVAQK